MKTRCLAASVIALGAALPAAGERALVVFLPGTPIESAAKLGAAVNDLGAYIDQRVPGLGLVTKPFRRWDDAAGFLRAQPASVSLILTDPAYLLDLPPGLSVVPGYRMVDEGRETQRKLVVVKAGDTARSLADLRGRALALAYGGGADAAQYLDRVVFDGQIAAEKSFSRLDRELDDFSALASLLFGRADAALVSAHNPLLATHLGKELRQVYASPPLSLPVLAIAESSLSAAQGETLDKVLREMAADAEGRRIIQALRLDGFRRVPEGGGPMERAGLLRLPAEQVKALELTAAAAPAYAAPPALKPDLLPYLLGIEIPAASPTEGLDVPPAAATAKP